MNLPNRILPRVQLPGRSVVLAAPSTPHPLHPAPLVWKSSFRARSIALAAALCLGTSILGDAHALSTQGKAADVSPLLTGIALPYNSRIAMAKSPLPSRFSLSTALASRPSVRLAKNSAKAKGAAAERPAMSAILPPMSPAMASGAAPAPVALPKVIRATTIAQQMRAVSGSTSSATRVLSKKEETKLALADGEPLRKVITVSALKQLPPASAPLPERMRRRSIQADHIQSKITERLAQSGDGPVRRPAQPITNSEKLPNQIEVAVGTFVVLLTTSDLDTVAIAEPNTADVAVVNSRAVLVNGKTPGVTSLVVVDKFRIRQYQVRVVAAPGNLPRDIAAQIGVPGVGVRQVRDAVVLEGEVGSEEEARRAAEIAALYSPKVVNQLTVRPGTPAANPVAAQIQEIIGLPNVRVRIVGESTIVEGTVENAPQKQKALALASTLSKNVIDMVELPRLTIEQIQESLVGLDAANERGITARSLGDQIILEGEASDPAVSQKATEIAQRAGLEVINRLRVPLVSEADRLFRTTVEDAIALRGVKVTGNSKLAILRGVVEDPNEASNAEQIARAHATEVYNFLQVRTLLPIDIDVSIVEISTDAARNLGIQLGSIGVVSESRSPGQTIVNPDTGAITVNPPSITRTIDPTFREGNFLGGNGFLGLGPTGLIDPVRVRLDALYRDGNARLLSNPRQVVNSGRRTAFQAGGQVPIPTLSSVGANGQSTAIEFKDFGVIIDVLPTATRDGVVTMRIFTEVSQPDFANGVIPPGGGSRIPGFTRRHSTSEVTVPARGTLAISGLIQNSITKQVSAIPVLSRIPILGELFKSKRFQKNQTELVIFISPRVLPNPLRPGQTAYYTPSQGLDNPGTATLATGSVQSGTYATGGLTTGSILSGSGVTTGERR